MNPLDSLWSKYYEWIDQNSFKDKKTGQIYSQVEQTTTQETSLQGE